jgi:hypothetical protein
MNNSSGNKSAQVRTSGVFAYENGDRYEGEMLHDKKDGVGVYRYANSDVYEGQYVDGKKHGTGSFRYSNGDVYTGTTVCIC